MRTLALASCSRAEPPTGDAGPQAASQGSSPQPEPGPADGTPASGTARAGYYRFPAIHGDTIVFTSEGDLWQVAGEGGVARRLTTGAGTELFAAISPDGRTVAFSAAYEGPKDVYTMPGGQGSLLVTPITAWAAAGTSTRGSSPSS